MVGSDALIERLRQSAKFRNRMRLEKMRRGPRVGAVILRRLLPRPRRQMREADGKRTPRAGGNGAALLASSGYT